MKLVWSPETASKAYISTVKSCGSFPDCGVAELLAAMAAGWNAKLILETWSNGDPIATSVGLAIAAGYTGGRHVCIVPDERSRSEYLRAVGGDTTAVEVVVGEAAELEGVDFLVVDSKRRDFVTVLRSTKLSSNGAVLARKNVFTVRELGLFRWSRVLERGTRVVRTVVLPVGKGLDIAYTGNSCNSDDGVGAGWKGNRIRWMEHVDQKSGEVHVFRL